MVEKLPDELFMLVSEDREPFVVRGEDICWEDNVVDSLWQPSVELIVSWEIPSHLQHEIIVHSFVDVLSQVDVVLPTGISCFVG